MHQHNSFKASQLCHNNILMNDGCKMWMWFHRNACGWVLALSQCPAVIIVVMVIIDHYADQLPEYRVFVSERR